MKNKKDVKTIFDLKLHESITIDEYYTVMKVPNGWIYEKRHFDGNIKLIFVPNNLENLIK